MGTSSTTRSCALPGGWIHTGLTGLLLVLAACASSESAEGQPGQDDQEDVGAGGAQGTGTGGGDPTEAVGVTVSVGAGGGAPLTCTTDTDCDDGDPCTSDVCDSETSGEISQAVCSTAAIAGCGDEEDDPQDDPWNPVDPSCADGGGEPVFLPYEPLPAPDLPASCDGGFEWQNCTTSFEQLALEASGADAVTLVVDLATYTAPDWLRIVATGVDGDETIILDTCRVRTAEHPDPTDGASRPPEEDIRRLHVEVPAGTRSLTFDSSRAPTPFYMRVLGLCGFQATGPADAQCAFRAATP